ncbi:MAG: hypothetical protein IH960_13795, partial [Chloroflexi bacterium]|nr:hypothetical protein [Chloroflexota bacterium]
MKTIKHCFIWIFLLIGLQACEPPAATDDEHAATGQRDQVDLIVAGDTVVTMDAARTVIEDGAVAVDDGVIVAVGTAAEITAKYSAKQTL